MGENGNVTSDRGLPQLTSINSQKPEKTSGKKSKVPVQLDLGNMLAVLEQKQISQKSKQESKPIILSGVVFFAFYTHSAVCALVCRDGWM